MKADRKAEESRIVGVRTTAAQARGRQAEALAAAHLVKHGVRLIARNLHCRGGEVDLIGLERDTVVFVEVRLRGNPRFGGAAASITPAKQRRVILAAQWWLNGEGRRYAQHACRFDAVLLDDLDAGALCWLKGAFDAA